MKFLLLWFIFVHVATLFVKLKKPELPFMIFNKLADLRDYVMDLIEQLRAPVTCIILGSLFCSVALPAHAELVEFKMHWHIDQDAEKEAQHETPPQHSPPIITIEGQDASDEKVVDMKVLQVPQGSGSIYVHGIGGALGDGPTPAGNVLVDDVMPQGSDSITGSLDFSVPGHNGIIPNLAEQYIICVCVKSVPQPGAANPDGRWYYYYGGMNIDPNCLPTNGDDQHMCPIGGDGWPGAGGEPNGAGVIPACGSPLAGDVTGYFRMPNSPVAPGDTSRSNGFVSPFDYSQQSRTNNTPTWEGLPDGCAANPDPVYQFSNRFWDWPGDLIGNAALLLKYLFVPPACALDDLKTDASSLFTYGPLGFPAELAAAFGAGVGCARAPSYVFKFINPADFQSGGCDGGNQAPSEASLLAPSTSYSALPGMPLATSLLPSYLDCTGMASAINVSRAVEKCLLWFFGLWAMARRLMQWASGLDWSAAETAYNQHPDVSYERTMRNL